MDFALLRERLHIVAERIPEIGGTVRELVMDPPATEAEIAEAERELGRRLPVSFRKALAEFSSNFIRHWIFPEAFRLTGDLVGIFGGSAHWGLHPVIECESQRKDWVKNVFSNPLDEYDKVWHNKLAFLDLGNGDFLAFDLNGGDDPPVVYLSHDDGEGHGYVLGRNFAEFLDHWSRLAFVGLEDWQWLPFVKDRSVGLDPECGLAREMREILKLNL